MKIDVTIDYEDALLIQGMLIGAAYRSETRAKYHEDSTPSKFLRRRADKDLKALNAFRAAIGHNDPLTADWLTGEH